MAAVPARGLRPRRPRALIAWCAAVAAAVAMAAGVLSADAHRVVSIIPATTEMLFAMGAGDRVVGVGSYDQFPPEVGRLPRVGALLDPDVERIISLRPDLVILYGTQADLREQLERAHIPFYPYEHRGLADIPQTIRRIGARVGVDDRADALAARVENDIENIRQRVDGLPRPRTLLVFGRQRHALTDIEASGGQGFLHDMLEAAGGTDVLADIHRQSVTMSTEMVLARAPEVIIELSYARGDPMTEADLADWNQLASVPAVRRHRVFLLSGNQFVVPGPRVAAATEAIARTLHPEAFK
ncbi:MAG TPA: ABC transporter substrate-binding protein [Vicinamibacterales bacterium]|jgi:iron complex transport system substrate-binding protein|nr:ABC transporter substrate-binding protein [Vicinamibacterales bacterium]